MTFRAQASAPIHKSAIVVHAIGDPFNVKALVFAGPPADTTSVV